MSTYFSVFVTFETLEQAREITRQAVDKRLAACANIIPQIESIYHWEDKVEESVDALTFFKTTKEQYPLLEAFIKEHHSYDVPCIVTLNIEQGNSEYLEWITKEVL